MRFIVSNGARDLIPMRGKHVVDNFRADSLRLKVKCTGTRKFSGDRESCERSSTEICVEYASAAISNHVEWTHNWICSHWQHP